MRRLLDRAVRAGLLLTCSVSAAVAQTDTSRVPVRDTTSARALAVVTVTGRADNLIGVASSASEGHIGSAELRLRPLTREGELLEAVPGLIVTQHSGDGKANQYFIRGFNLDHGTDFQTRVEGMPVNSPTHAHGQGYTDLNFLIPELVDYIDYRLGAYHTALGDFGSAGGAELHLKSRLDGSFATLETGAYALARAALGTAARIGRGDLLLGGELKSYNGPWVLAEDIRKLSGLARYSWQRHTSHFSLLGMAYHNRWNASDQIPERAVEDGAIDRYGNVDGTDGGNTARYSLSGTWNHIGGKAVQSVQVFGVYSDLSLFSNFTYFLDDSVHGDQFNQREHRVTVGANASQVRSLQALGVEHTVTVGVQSRADFLSPVGLYRTEHRERLSTVREDRVTETGTGVYVEAQSRWRPWLRTTLGMRGDGYTFDVASDRAENSGRRSAAIASPKASLVIAPTATTELYLSGGLGFHSNDARGTTIAVDPATGDPAQRVNPLVRSHGAEIGLRANPVPGWRSTFAVWALDLDSELLFVGDGGTTEPSHESRRSGVTLANFYRPVPQLSLDADISFARARFAGADPGADRVPGALENVLAGGIAWAAVTGGPFGAIRIRHFGSYPLVENNGVRASATTLVNASVAYPLGGMLVQASVLNLLDARASDIQYYYASRLPGVAPSGAADVHFLPAEPRQLRISLGWGKP